MPERARSAKPLLIVGLLVVTVATLGGNYFLDLRRHDGRTAAARTDNDLRSAELGLSDLRGAEASYLALAANQDGATSWMNSATALQVQLEAAIANLNSMTTSAAVGKQLTQVELIR